MEKLVASMCCLASPCRMAVASSLKICVVFLRLSNCDGLWPQCRLEKPRGGCRVDQLASAPKKKTCHLSIARTSLPHPESPHPSPDTHPACGPGNEDGVGVTVLLDTDAQGGGVLCSSTPAMGVSEICNSLCTA